MRDGDNAFVGLMAAVLPHGDPISCSDSARLVKIIRELEVENESLKKVALANQNAALDLVNQLKALEIQIRRNHQ